MERQNNDSVLFTRTHSSPVLMALLFPVAISLGAGVFFAVEGGPFMIVLLSVVSLAVLGALVAFASLKISLTPGGLSIQSSVLKLRILHIPVTDMLEVHLDRSSALVSGGWGYRVKGRDTAVILDGGESAAIRRRNGRRVFVAFNGAGELVKEINTLLTSEDQEWSGA